MPNASSCIALVKAEYWHADAPGSLASTSDQSGHVTARCAYDPCGKRRYTDGRVDACGNIVVDWYGTPAAGTARGFGTHEQLDDVGLVNMNGRLLDPTLGRFVQPDPFVRSPRNLQSYNRRAHCFGNPLNCTALSTSDARNATAPLVVRRSSNAPGHVPTAGIVRRCRRIRPRL